MVTIHKGTRISKQAPLRVCCTAAILDEQDRILLIQRDDDRTWSFPGGGMDSGESVTEACEREVLEETGLNARARKLLGVYSNVDRMFEYPDGNRWQHVDLLFLCEVISGTLRPTDEALDARFFSRDECSSLEMHDGVRERINDVLTASKAIVLR